MVISDHMEYDSSNRFKIFLKDLVVWSIHLLGCLMIYM